MTVSARKPILAIDAGNTRIKFGWFSNSSGDVLPVCESLQFVRCGEEFPACFDEESQAASAAVLSGSNPPEIARIVASWNVDRPPLTVISDRSQLPVEIDVDAPDKVGMDRLLNAVAAVRLRDPGQPVVIVDSGTAVTVDCLDRDGRFCGGAILPGMGMSARALHQYTALLPQILAPDITTRTPEIVGRNTYDAMRSGLFWGHVGAVRELVRQMEGLHGVASRPRLLVTGGAGVVLTPYLPDAESQPHLPLQGLVLAFESRTADKGTSVR